MSQTTDSYAWFVFEPDGTYVITTSDVMSAEGVAVALEETGTYSVAGDAITFVPTDATCPTHAATYMLQGANLLLSTDAAAYVLAPTDLPPGSNSTTLQPGCFS